MHFQRAIVTGASSGFGEAFARRLAPSVEELVLVARRRERLEQLAERLVKEFPGLRIVVEPSDLADEKQRRELLGRLNALPPVGTLLVNNAGLGDYGELLTSNPERNAAMLAVNIAAPTELCRGLLPVLARHGGGIINVASLAAELPIPDFAVYAASKAYLASFSEALRLEMKEYGVPVVAVCPGPVRTGFGAVARREGFTGNMTPCRDLFDTSIACVVNDSLRALASNRARVYPSFKITAAARLLRLLPLPFLRAVLSRRPRKIAPSSER